MERAESLAERAYRSLKRDILQCRLRPGAVIADGELAERYGMSRTPLREALTVLRQEGLVVVLPRRGTFVKALDLGELHDVFRVRAVLEPEAAVLAAQRATPADLDGLAELGAATTDDTLDQPSVHEANRVFHVGIARISGIPVLVDALNTVHQDIERFLNLQGVLGRPYRAANHHRLVDLLRDGNEAEIRTSVLRGIESSRAHMVEALLPAAGPTTS